MTLSLYKNRWKPVIGPHLPCLHNKDAVAAGSVCCQAYLTFLYTIERKYLCCLQAEGHWEKALGLNPLFPQGWFALGYCCLKTHNSQRALQASNSTWCFLQCSFLFLWGLILVCRDTKIRKQLPAASALF